MAQLSSFSASIFLIEKFVSELKRKKVSPDDIEPLKAAKKFAICLKSPTVCKRICFFVDWKYMVQHSLHNVLILSLLTIILY